MIGVTFDPWQQWLSIHAGELLEDGRPRFRIILAIIARQNGKTLWAKIAILYWMAVEQQLAILGLSTDRSYAKITWNQVIDMADECPYIDYETRKSIGEEELKIGKSIYRFAANNGRAGRSLTLDRLLLDEIRQHTNWDAWSSCTNAMQARSHAQALCITNQGDDESVVLNSLRESAIDYLNTGKGDPRLGIFEWSAPDGAEADEPHALAAANPNLGDRIQLETLQGAARRAIKAGGEELATFRTEVLCQKIAMFDAAIDEVAWAACANPAPISMKEHRNRVALCFDVSMAGDHATLVAAVEVDGQIHVEVVQAWDGYGCISDAQRDLAATVRKVRPAVIGWYPKGPAAGITADMRPGWEPRNTEIEEIHTDLTAVCMGLKDAVVDRSVAHNDDPMLNRHVTLAQRLPRGDAWVFTRKGSSAVDGAYATAGAVHLVRTMPPPKPPLRVA